MKTATIPLSDPRVLSFLKHYCCTFLSIRSSNISQLAAPLHVGLSLLLYPPHTLFHFLGEDIIQQREDEKVQVLFCITARWFRVVIFLFCKRNEAELEA